MAVIKSEYLLPNYDPEEVGMKGEKGDDGKTSYVHIAYSNSSDGGVDFSTTDPTNRAYTGYYTDFEMIDSTNPSKYEWQRTKGDSGKDGVAGKDGVGLKSTTITYASHTNASTPPSTGWQTQVPKVPAGQFLWTKTVWTYTDSSSETGYSVARMGQDGAKGNDGVAGKDGVGIKTTLIEYVVSTSGTVRPTSGWSTTIPVTPEGQYLWTRTTWTYTDNTTEQGYSVARQGAKGDSSHFHTAYAWSADGTDRFTKVYPGENFIRNSTFENGMTGWTGTSYWNIDTATQLNEHSSVKCTSASASDVTKALRHAVTLGDLAVGDDVVWSVWAKSDTPNSKIHLEIWGSTYSIDATIGTEWTRVSLSGKLGAVFAVFVWNITPGTFWVSEPKLERGGTPTIYTPAPSEDYANAYPTYTGTYSDFNVEGSDNPKDYAWVRSMGNAGATGDDGVGIATTIVEYNKSTNSTTPPSTGWTSTIPSISGGQYLWTRVTLNYTDGKKAESYTVARQGEDGADGQLFTGETEPTDFNEGDIWYKVVSGKVTGVYEAKGGAWVEIPFESSVIAETIIGKTIQASHLTGSTIDGGKISGAEFLNEYANVTSGVNQVTDGKLGIKDGILQAGSTYYLTNSSGERLYKFATTEADIHQGTVNLRQRLYDDAGKQTSESTTSVSGGLISLSLTDASGNYHGLLDAKALTRTPWINLQMGSDWTARNYNGVDQTPQYRIIYNLDGSRTIKFRGEIQLKTGTMSVGKAYTPFNNGAHTLPADVRPQSNVSAYAPVGVTSGTTFGGQWALVPSGYWSLGVAQNNTSYANLATISYDIV